jgi:peptidyl-prolyl cis-trans isomerase A (cyclophilin A)
MKTVKNIFAITSLVVLMGVLLTGCNQQTMTDTDKEVADTSQVAQRNSIAVIETNYGTMEVELFEQRAPITTKNFIDLAEKEYYDGLAFHRVIKDFMIQGGDPNGDGSGGPGYSIKDEFHLELKHSKAGILSMANRGPDTGGSQFFITLVATPHLDGKHAVFGQVIKGSDVLQEIGSVDISAGDKPLQPVVMEKVTIRKP